MPMAISNVEKYRDGRTWRVRANLTFSGTYPTGGETLSFASFGVPQGLSASRKPWSVIVDGKAGFKYSYAEGTGRDDGKVIVYTNTAGGANSALGEHTNATYVAGVSGDVVTVTAELRA